jgi:hypothetical protein
MDWGFIGVILSVATLVLGFQYLVKTGRNKDNQDFVDRIKKAADAICEKAQAQFDDASPIPLKKGEHFIAEFPNTRMATYKCNGQFAYAAAVFRYKGLRLGSGQVIRQKDWIFDQEGTLYLTSDKLIFDGGTSNVEVPYGKMLNLDVHNHYGKGLYVNKRTGKDIMFVIEGVEYKADKVATALLIQRGNVKLKAA